MAINDIAIWKSALSSGNITTIYNSGTPTNITGIDDSNLKRYYQFETLPFNKKYFLPPTDNTGTYGTYGLNSDAQYNAGSAAVGPWGTLNAQGVPNYGDVWGVSFWIKPASSDAVYNQEALAFYILGSGSDHSLSFRAGHKLESNSTGSTYLFVKYITPAGSAKEFRCAATTMTLGSWNHCTISKTTTTTTGAYASTDIDFYINGTQATTDTTPTGNWEEHTWTTNLWINRKSIQLFDAGWPLTRIMPSIDEFSFWNKDISGDAATLYNSGVPTDLAGSSGLYGYYRMGEGDSNGDGTGTADTYQLLHDMSGTSGTTFDTEMVANNFSATMTGIMTSHPTGIDTAEKYTAMIGSQATILEHYDNTKYFNIPSNNKYQRIKIPGIANDGTVGVTPVIENTRDWTVSCWINSAVGNGDIWAVGKLIGLQVGYWSSKINIQSIDGSTTRSDYGAFPANLWTHFVVVFKGVASDGDTWDMDADTTSETTPGVSAYINGEQIPRVDGNSTTSTGTFGGLEFSWLQRYPNPYAAFKGKYDNLAIFNHKKSAAQILAMYNEGHGTNLANDSNCVSLLRADDMTTAAISDEATVTNSGGASSADDYVAKWDDGGGSGTLTVTEY
jgi:hypothetical protein